MSDAAEAGFASRRRAGTTIAARGFDEQGNLI